MTNQNNVVKITNYSEALDYLYRLRLFGTKLGLHNIRRLLELLGDPHQGLAFYHIAGTNGKGSVAAILQSLLRTTHRRVGLYISPHLENFRERIRINNRLISPRAVTAGVEEMRPLLDRVARSPGCSHPTYFEAVTALACRYFRREGADAVVWEVGLGGRLDATNVVRPLVSVVTNVSLEHQQYLGRSIDLIVREKGGIIKNGVPLVTAARNPKVRACLRRICRRARAPMIEVDALYKGTVAERSMTEQRITVTGPRRVYADLVLPLPGDHQVANCATALAAWEASDPRAGEVASSRIRRSLRRVSWPGRFEFIPGPPDVVLDGAHNRSGAAACAKTMRMLVPDRPIILILGVLADKDVGAICRPLVPLAWKVIAVRPASSRGLPASELARVCRRSASSGKIPVLVRKSLESALESCYRICFSGRPAADRRPPLICITGSLRLVGPARRMIMSHKM
ncbi:MAG: folylpolyglutamate synthase/dihydrofolate synthase family protein [PVC group bacterium]